MEKRKLVFRSWRCSGAQLGFGQEFLTKEQFDNTGVSPTFTRFGFSWFLTARLKSAVKGRGSWDADIVKNAAEELKGFYRLPSIFPISWQSLAEDCTCIRGLFWRKCSLNDFTLVFPSKKVNVATIWSHHLVVLNTVYQLYVSNIYGNIKKRYISPYNRTRRRTGGVGYSSTVSLTSALNATGW